MAEVTKRYRLKESRKGLGKGYIIQVTAWYHPDSQAIRRALVQQTSLSDREAGEITYSGYWEVLD